MTTPEAERAWIEVEISPLPGGWWIRPVTATGQPGTVSMSVQTVRQRPADVPSLGHGTIADAFAGLEAMGEALRMAASPPQATQDDPQPPNAADQPTSPRDDPGATQRVTAWDLLGIDPERERADPDVMAIQSWDAHERAELAEARAENARLRQQRNDAEAERDAAQIMQAAAHQRAEKDLATYLKRGAELAQMRGEKDEDGAEIVRLIQQRDAARRELQQLRGTLRDLEKNWLAEAESLLDLRDESVGTLDLRDESVGTMRRQRLEAVASAWRAASHYLGAALAGTTPTTQDGQQT